eukprot:1173025-Amphidinium_carterae.1
MSLIIASGLQELGDYFNIEDRHVKRLNELMKGRKVHLVCGEIKASKPVMLGQQHKPPRRTSL